MKQISVLLALATSLALAGCSVVADPATGPTAPTSPNVVYPEGYGPSASDSTEPADESPEPEAGSLESPYPKGYTATISQDGDDYYSVKFTLTDTNANNEVNAANQFNDKAPKGYHYVMIKATFMGLGTEAVDAGYEMYSTWQMADEEGNLYNDSSVVLPDGVADITDAPDLYKGQKYTGSAVFAVPDSAKSLYMSGLGSYITM